MQRDAMTRGAVLPGVPEDQRRPGTRTHADPSIQWRNKKGHVDLLIH